MTMPESMIFLALGEDGSHRHSKVLLSFFVFTLSPLGLFLRSFSTSAIFLLLCERIKGVEG